jgi:hypothetical protein
MSADSEIGELTPPRGRRRFVNRDEFAALSRTASDVRLDSFRADQDAGVDFESEILAALD